MIRDCLVVRILRLSDALPGSGFRNRPDKGAVLRKVSDPLQIVIDFLRDRRRKNSGVGSWIGCKLSLV